MVARSIQPFFYAPTLPRLCVSDALGAGADLLGDLGFEKLVVEPTSKENHG
jgi:hypothetical protein